MRFLDLLDSALNAFHFFFHPRHLFRREACNGLLSLRQEELRGCALRAALLHKRGSIRLIISEIYTLPLLMLMYVTLAIVVTSPQMSLAGQVRIRNLS